VGVRLVLLVVVVVCASCLGLLYGCEYVSVGCMTLRTRFQCVGGEVGGGAGSGCGNVDATAVLILSPTFNGLLLIANAVSVSVLVAS
jgi:hypothetical protein